MHCDILVIGAGPAGSTAAMVAASGGANTILIEKKARIGKIACAEAISPEFFSLLPFTIPKEQLLWKTDGMILNTENMKIELKGKMWRSYSVDRIKFDNWLVSKAVNAGTKLFLETELADLHHRDYNIKKAIVKLKNNKKEIEPKVVIIADGAESETLNLLGLYRPRKNDIAHVHSWEFDNIELKDNRMEQIFLGKYSNGGYAYIFPKSKNRANVGVGSVLAKNMENAFEEFIRLEEVREQLKKGKKEIERSGKIIIRNFLKKIVYGNTMVVGDAAAQNLKPFAEGILPAMICGGIAGKTAMSFIQKKKDLEDYPMNVNKILGKYFKESDKMCKAIYDLVSVTDVKKYEIQSGLYSGLIKPDHIQKFKKIDLLKLKEYFHRYHSDKLNVSFR